MGFDMFCRVLRLKVTRRLSAAALLCAALLGGCGENLTNPPDLSVYEPAEAEPLTCVPNLDGKIEASELREALGVPVTLRVSPAGQTRGVDLAGGLDSAGDRVWDWSAEDLTDQTARIEASAVSDWWFAASFPDGQFVTPIDAGGRNVGVYKRDDEAFYLLGLASAEPDPPEGRTLFVYQEPIALYRFPLEVGKTWISAGTVRDAVFRGLPYAGRDLYEVTVEAEGELRLPEITFDRTLQIRTKVTVEPAVGQAVVTQQVGYLFECFGEVARATSQNNEADPFFETAAEVRRLGLGLP